MTAITAERLVECRALAERLHLMDEQNATASIVWRSPRERVYGEAADAVDRLVAEVERLRAALFAMRARDDRNGSLPIWYREQIDAALPEEPANGT